jgi:hypothetical protein
MTARRTLTAAASATVVALASGGAIASQATPNDRRPTTTVDGAKAAAANPYLGLVRDPAKVDGTYWKRWLRQQSAREAARQAAAPPAPVVYDEEEPEGTFGSNDDQPSAERITGFGTGAGQDRAVRVLGELSTPDVETEPLTTAEDNGAIPLATATEIPDTRDGVEVDSEIGDGPHGSAGSGSGDFDFYALNGVAGQTITLDTAGSGMDTVVAIYDAEGNLLDLNDDARPDFTSLLRFQVPADGEYFAFVGGFSFFGGLPEDPFDSGSGTGFGEEGDYHLVITHGEVDRDYFAVRLRSGDVLGGTIDEGSADIVVHRLDGSQGVGSTQDASSIYPANTPLPGGGNAATAYVAEETGWYAVSTEEGDGGYQMQLEVYRPGSETAGRRAVQKVFLDFDGARVNTAIWGGPGVRTLSPFSAFIARWGLPRSAEDQLINRIVATVRENLRHDLVEQGLNDDFAIQILNSRDHADPFGRPNVSRVIVGGTIAQSGIDTIGIAQTIDPGNFGHEESALVLLDVLSGSPDAEGDASLNYYVGPGSHKVRWVSQAVGNVVSHEVGHMIGSFHVDQFNDVLNLMDQGGNFPLLYGAGPDGVGGTADDWDVDFGEDTYNPGEGFSGIEDTLNNSAWAFVRGSG